MVSTTLRTRKKNNVRCICILLIQGHTAIRCSSLREDKYPKPRAFCLWGPFVVFQRLEASKLVNQHSLHEISLNPLKLSFQIDLKWLFSAFSKGFYKKAYKNQAVALGLTILQNVKQGGWKRL